MTEIPEEIKREAKKELARRRLWDYCQLRYPTIYKDDRLWLKELVDGIQAFIEQDEKKFLIINIPPRHFKSLTGTCAVEWLLGQDFMNKVMTGSYNETLSTTFAKKVRDVIDENPSKGNEVYNDIFPDTKVKYGQASKSLWSLEGSPQDNYLATSPTGTATGFGANYMLLDDLVKSAAEAYNQKRLQDIADWFDNTMMSRLEGSNWKVLAIMTRWAKGDLAGHIIDTYPDLVQVISFSAVQEDGTMLCPEVLSRRDYEIKTAKMNPDIREANYNQNPIDVKGRLYKDLMTYDVLPEGEFKKWSYTDTADKGTDYLVTVNYILTDDKKVYITDAICTDEPMEITEPLVAKSLHDDGVHEAIIESNNGGRGFGRNVKRLLQDVYGNFKVIITDLNQRSNKESRIRTSSTWVKQNIYFPEGWDIRYPEFFNQVTMWNTKGKNEHDDACFPAGTMIATTRGDIPIESIKVGDKVITPVGPRKVIDSKMTGVKSVIKVNELTATPNHKVWDGRGFTRLDVLTGNYDKLSMLGFIKWKYKKLLYSMESPIDSWDRESITSASQLPIMEESVLRDFIGRCGSIIRERQFRKAIKFTISTATLIITSIATYSVYLLRNTLRYISNKATGKGNDLQTTHYKKRQSGTRVKLVGSGTKLMQSCVGREWNTRIGRVYSAIKSTLRHSQTRYTAQTHVAVSTGQEAESDDTALSVPQTSPLGIAEQSTARKSARHSQGVAVYNITVEEAGCYYADGVLVSNCDVLAGIYDTVNGSLDYEDLIGFSN